MNPELFERIYQKHAKVLHNTGAKNRQLLICFSGVPGSGKTFNAKLLESQFRGIRISSSEINDVLGELKYPPDNKLRRETIHEYTKQLLGKLSGLKNGLLILDSSIDRKYKLVFDWAKANLWPVFVISMEFSKEDILARIKARAPQSYAEYSRHLGYWLEDQLDFLSRHEADFVINADLEELPEDLVKIISKKLNP
jgi:predicted kinase